MVAGMLSGRMIDLDRNGIYDISYCPFYDISYCWRAKTIVVIF